MPPPPSQPPAVDPMMSQGLPIFTPDFITPVDAQFACNYEQGEKVCTPPTTADVCRTHDERVLTFVERCTFFRFPRVLTHVFRCCLARTAGEQGPAVAMPPVADAQQAAALRVRPLLPQPGRGLPENNPSARP
jgi:hypothetical protein